MEPYNLTPEWRIAPDSNDMAFVLQRLITPGPEATKNKDPFWRSVSYGDVNGVLCSFSGLYMRQHAGTLPEAAKTLHAILERLSASLKIDIHISL